MATLLHHIHPWMQKAIAEAEDQIDKKVYQQIEKRIQESTRLDAFELRVLACPTPNIYLMTLQADMVSLRADADAILDMRVLEPEAALVELP